MTEKEKMVRGALYAPNEEELLQERLLCKDLCQRFNGLLPSQRKEAAELLQTLFGACGGPPWVEAAFWCDYGYRIQVGKNFYMNHGCVILDAGGVTFGDNVAIGPQCGFYTSGHPLDAQERSAGLEYARPIRVGGNVWIGGGVLVMPGVTIGENTVVGAGSVVTRELPANVVAAGNPCRVLRPITAADRMVAPDLSPEI